MQFCRVLLLVPLVRPDIIRDTIKDMVRAMLLLLKPNLDLPIVVKQGHLLVPILSMTYSEDRMLALTTCGHVDCGPCSNLWTPTDLVTYLPQNCVCFAVRLRARLILTYDAIRKSTDEWRLVS